MRLRWWVFGPILLTLVGFLLLRYLITQVWPNADAVFAGPQLLFLLLLFVTLGAASVPITAYLNYRFANPVWLERDKFRLLRQGAWVGVVGVVMAYLQLIRALNWTIAAVLICVFILIEVFFLTRE